MGALTSRIKEFSYVLGNINVYRDDDTETQYIIFELKIKIKAI